MSEAIVYIAYLLIGAILGWSFAQIRVNSLRKELTASFRVSEYLRFEIYVQKKESAEVLKKSLRDVITSTKSFSLSGEGGKVVGANPSVGNDSLPLHPLNEVDQEGRANG